MKRIGIIRNWIWPDLRQQTRGCSGIWDEMHFTEANEKSCDYLVVLNNLPDDQSLDFKPERVIRVVQEPPTEFFKAWHTNPPYASITLSCDPEKQGESYLRHHPMVPWHINRNYDFLSTAAIPPKKSWLSWITSTKTILQGHRKRMEFLHQISGQIPGLELIGNSINHITHQQKWKENAELQRSLGFRFVDDKWAGLAPYRYSLAIENFSGPDYWTEKLADCYLAWTLPIYYGCTNLEDYFPAESFIRIDIEKPDEAIDIIRRVLFDDPWGKKIEAIREARRRVLDHHQMFPALARIIRNLSGTPSKISHWTSFRHITQIKTAHLFHRSPKISVIVCTYNRTELLAKCLQSLTNQNIPINEYEVIIVNNHSSDTTPETAEQFVNCHPNFHYIEENQPGLSHARNRGVMKSRADYIAFIDDDSIADHNWLGQAIEIIRQHQPDIFGGAVFPLISEDTPPWYRYSYAIRGDMGETGWIDQGFIIGTNIFFRKSLLSEYGGFDPDYGMNGEQLGYHEETKLVLRAFRENRKVYFSRELLVFDIIPEYKKSLAYFIFSQYQAGRQGLSLWNSEYKPESIRSILALLKQTMQEFNNALMKRDMIRYPYPENYLIENKILKYFFKIGLMSEFLLQQDDNHPETT